MSEAEAALGQALGEVMEADAAMREELRAAGPADPVAEAGALASLFADEGACSVCEAKLGSRYATCLAQWASWEGAPREQLGGEINRVVECLDAAHLLPSGIHERLTSGNDAACFGLATLLDNMEPPAAAAPAESASKQ